MTAFSISAAFTCQIIFIIEVKFICWPSCEDSFICCGWLQAYRRFLLAQPALLNYFYTVFVVVGVLSSDWQYTNRHVYNIYRQWHDMACHGTNTSEVRMSVWQCGVHG